jgi:hypothetical protein
MSTPEKSPTGPLLLGMLVVLCGLAILLIAMGSYPIGIALLAVAIALLPNSIKAMKARKTDDAG